MRIARHWTPPDQGRELHKNSTAERFNEPSDHIISVHRLKCSQDLRTTLEHFLLGHYVDLTQHTLELKAQMQTPNKCLAAPTQHYAKRLMNQPGREGLDQNGTAPVMSRSAVAYMLHQLLIKIKIANHLPNPCRRELLCICARFFAKLLENPIVTDELI